MVTWIPHRAYLLLMHARYKLHVDFELEHLLAQGSRPHPRHALLTSSEYLDSRIVEQNGGFVWIQEDTHIGYEWNQYLQPDIRDFFKLSMSYVQSRFHFEDKLTSEFVKIQDDVIWEAILGCYTQVKSNSNFLDSARFYLGGEDSNKLEPVYAWIFSESFRTNIAMQEYVNPHQVPYTDWWDYVSGQNPSQEETKLKRTFSLFCGAEDSLC